MNHCQRQEGAPSLQEPGYLRNRRSKQAALLPKTIEKKRATSRRPNMEVAVRNDCRQNVRGYTAKLSHNCNQEGSFTSSRSQENL